MSPILSASHVAKRVRVCVAMEDKRSAYELSSSPRGGRRCLLPNVPNPPVDRLGDPGALERPAGLDSLAINIGQRNVLRGTARARVLTPLRPRPVLESLTLGPHFARIDFKPVILHDSGHTTRSSGHHARPQTKEEVCVIDFEAVWSFSRSEYSRGRSEYFTGL